MFLCQKKVLATHRFLLEPKVYHFHSVVSLTRHTKTLTHIISHPLTPFIQVAQYNQPTSIFQNIHHLPQTILKFTFFVFTSFVTPPYPLHTDTHRQAFSLLQFSIFQPEKKVFIIKILWGAFRIRDSLEVSITAILSNTVLFIY